MKKYLVLFFIFFKFYEHRFNCVCAIQTDNDIVLKLNQKSVFPEKKENEVIHVIADNIRNDTSVSVAIDMNSIQSSLYFTDTADCLKYIPGFSMIRHGGTNSDLVFRGMYGSRIRVLMDNSEIIGTCCARMDPAVSYINPENFDILNIIKGPQTVLYGPAISGGIVQFQRYHPCCYAPKIQLRSDITFGSNDSIRKNIDSILDHKYGYMRLIGNIAHSDDYYDGNNHQVHSAWYKWNADAILTFILKELDMNIEISIGQGNGRANYASSIMDGLCFERENYGLKMDIVDINDFLSKIELHTWHYHIHHLMGNSKFYTNLANKNPITIPITAKKHCCSTCTINDLDRLLWGMRSIAKFEWENVQCFSGIDSQINHYKTHKKYNDNYAIGIFIRDIGIFSECTFDLLSNHKFIGGARIEYTITNIYGYRNVPDQHSNVYPTGFIRYENNIHPSLFYYIGIGTSQCFPDYWKLVSSICSDDIKKIEQIFRLKSEKTIQIDTGIHFEKSKINSWISSYVGYIKDYAYYNSDTYFMQNSMLNYINHVHAQIFGSEIGFGYKFNDYWYSKSYISWARGININNQCIFTEVSPLEGILVCQFRQKNYYLEASWRLVSPSKSINKNFLVLVNYDNTDLSQNNINISGFGVFSAHATWEISKYITYHIGINNLFNKSYSEYNSGCNYYKSEKFKKVPIYEPGRTWWIKAKILF